MTYPVNPFGLRTVDELFDIYEVAHLADKPPSAVRSKLRRSGVEPVARRGRRVLYRGADVWPLQPDAVVALTLRAPARTSPPDVSGASA